MDEITQGEAEEFWKWCGCYRERLRGRFRWITPDEYCSNFLPPITLDNLFKYCVYGKLPKIYRNWKSLLHDWVDELTGDMDKDTELLFRICQEVMRNE